MATITNKATIVNTLIGAAGIILGVTVSLSMAHISNLSIHEKRETLVKQPEFIQFQQRVLDGIGNIQITQQQLRQDIKDMQKSINDK